MASPRTGRKGSGGDASITTDVTSLVLGALAVVTVVASFAFSLAVLVVSRQPQTVPARDDAPTAGPAPTAEPATDDASETMSRVLRDVERLATLRERGALTDKEFAAQKAKLLVPANPRTRSPQRT